MGVVGDILLVLLTIVGVLVLLVLVMPISVRASGAAADSELELELRGSWAFGLFAVRWRMFHGAAVYLFGARVARIRPDTPEKKAETRRKRAEKKARKAERALRKRQKPKKKRGPTWAWRHRRTLWRATLRVIRTLHIDGRVAGVVGMSDPDHTAWLGVAIDQLADRLPPGTIDVEVDYMDEVLAVGGHIQSRVWPIEVLVVLAAVRFGGEMRRALRAA